MNGILEQRIILKYVPAAIRRIGIEKEESMTDKFIRIKLPIEPVPQGRPKVAFKNGATWTYYSPTTVKAREEFTTYIKSHAKKIFPEHFPLRLTISYYRQRSRWVGKSEPIPVRKPDLNNLLSLALDCMSKILYPDDAQVSKVIMKKRWAAGGNWRVPGYIELELTEDKLTRSEKAERDIWDRDKLKIAQWERKEERKSKRRKHKVASKESI